MFKQILLITIICAATLSAQDWWGTGIAPKVARPYTSFWTPTFVDTTYNQSANTMLIDYNAVRGDTLKTVGGRRFIPYVKVYQKVDSLGTVDSVRGYNYTINITEGNDSLWFTHQGYGYWTNKAKAQTWVYSDIDSLFTPDYYDNIPDQFTFNDIVGAELNTQYQDSVILQGMMASASAEQLVVGATQATFTVSVLGDWTQFTKTVNNGDTVWIRFTTSGSYSTESYYTIRISGVIDTFSVTTKAAPAPEHFYLVNKEDGKLVFKSGTYAIKFKD